MKIKRNNGNPSIKFYVRNLQYSNFAANVWAKIGNIFAVVVVVVEIFYLQHNIS